jgi:hypothetical protein
VFGIAFSIVYLMVMQFGWQLFTYYPTVNEFTLLNHAPTAAVHGPPMKWYGYVAMTAVVSTIIGWVSTFLPYPTGQLGKTLRHFVWITPMIASVVLLYMIVVLGD